LNLGNISACAKENGWRGAGKYLMPLLKSAPTTHLIAPVPRGDEVRIYPWTPEAEAQLKPFLDAKK
jgi:hypothetical protein